MSNPDGVLDAIDACLEDCEVSDDAMRWTLDDPALVRSVMTDRRPLPGTGMDPSSDTVVVAVSGVATDEMPASWAAVRVRDGLAVGARFDCDDRELTDWQLEYMSRMNAVHGGGLFFLVCTPTLDAGEA